MQKHYLTPLLFLMAISMTFAQKGMLHVGLSGLPPGLEPGVSLTGPQGFSRTLSKPETFSNLPSGMYEVKSEICIQRQEVISKAFRPDNLTAKIMIKNDTQRVNVNFKLMPGSNKLWAGNKNAATNTSTHIIGFEKDKVQATQTSNATIKLTNKITSAQGIAFDRYGNLWVADAYTVKMFEWNSLDKSNILPKVVHSLKDPCPCLSFDAEGNLWISNGKKIGVISRIPFNKLYVSGTPKPDIVLSGKGISGVQNIAFDQHGNLWANHDENKSIVKLNNATIQHSSDQVEADVMISCQSKPPVIMTLSGPKALAFDKQGNLWVGFFGPNVIAVIPTSQLNTSAVITPEVQLTLSLGALLHSIAFDESGGLWTAFSSGKFGKISPDQLTRAGKITPEVVITCPELKYASGMAFYPLPLGLPLK